MIDYEENPIEEENEFDADELIVRKKKAPVEPRKLVVPELLKGVAANLEALREKKPLAMCLTNHVSSALTANALLALGASPAMIEDTGEASEFVTKVDALLVNVGTLTKSQAEVMRGAVAKANSVVKPWVLDPVAVGVFSLRTYLAKELVRRFPSIVRANASEILGLSGLPISARGVDSIIESDKVITEAKRLAEITHATVLVTGATDYVAAEDGAVLAIKNGDPMMTRVAGIGCAQGAICSAFLGVTGRQNRFEAAVAAGVVTALAGEKAMKSAKGPGSFVPAFLDALNGITANDIVKLGKIEPALGSK